MPFDRTAKTKPESQIYDHFSLSTIPIIENCISLFYDFHYLCILIPKNRKKCYQIVYVGFPKEVGTVLSFCNIQTNGLTRPVHLAIGLVEGAITAAVLLFVFQARPQLLQGYDLSDGGRMKTSVVVSVLAAAAVVTGGLLSLFASSHPDGLEWSIEKVTGSTELESASTLHLWAARIQEKLALLPDYDFLTPTDGAGTSFSGIVGALLVLVVCVTACLIILRIKRAGK